jgi:hypothetical protein
MGRRRILLLSALGFLATLAALAVLNARMTSTGGPGIVGLEFAGTRHRALEIMREWGRDGVTAARWANVVDYGFIAAYAVLLSVAARGAGAGRLVLALPLVAAAADAVQNGALLLLLGGHGEGFAPPLAFACGVVTSTLAAITLVYVAAVRLRPSRSASRS